MKNTSKPLCGIGHDAIRTQHVYIENDQVFLKGNVENTEEGSQEKEEWFPINFQWIPIARLNRTLEQQIPN